MSDPLEARFGWYHQANGGNHFISIKQLLQTEKKIRCLSLLQQRALQSASRLFLDDSSPTSEQTNVVPDTSDLESYLCDLTVHDLSQTDCCVAYLISGYIARNVSGRRKCDSCKALLIKNNDSDLLDKYLDNENMYLLKLTDHRGLAVPTDYCFAVCSMAVQAYDSIISDEVLKQKLMKFSNQRYAFI